MSQLLGLLVANGTTDYNFFDSVSGLTTTVPVTVASGGGGGGLSGLAFTYDDFTGYANTAGFLANVTVNNPGGTGPSSGAFYDDGTYASLASIDESITYNGHHTLKLSQPTGVANTPTFAHSFTSTTHIWYRVKVRFSPGWTTVGTGGGASAYKMLSWNWSAYDGSGRLELTLTNEYQLYENVQSKSGGALVGGGTYLLDGHITNEWSDGNWYDYIIEVDHSVKPGFIRLWRALEGSTPVFQGEEPQTMDDGSFMPPLTAIYMGLNYNQPRTAAQALWWGQWEVVDGTAHTNPFGV